MPDANPAALDFLLTRRSRPAKTLTGPAPDRAGLRTLLTAASRSPDHGKLEPWRFIVLERAALDRLAAAAVARGEAAGLDPEQIEKGRKQFADSPLCVAVIETPKTSPKVPALEQTYAVGGVCLALLNAALAAGWGANWLTGWVAHDRTLTAEALALSDAERVAGFIHIGTETSRPPERPRPDLDRIVTWQDA
ncbi:Nitroreductase [Roseivivax lentus]|uniref:Putative NAD(P)H nitroreductase n=1 Tax=Roseivivax lentus TaxID=633194 RepID=A0A1N7MHY1_9RHOB|nr:nitroreductase [Roseivivax lentus]SIS85677.1 Nitroreductase [Roseivivax lentus]